MKKTLTLIKKSLAAFTLFAFAVGSFGATPQVARAITLNWDTTGSYVLDMVYNGDSYLHDMSLVQDDQGSLAGNGGSPAGANMYTWVINSGSVSENSINFTANYTATPDAVEPQTVLTLTGTIAPDGTMSGTWSDNYQAGSREGTWSTTSGEAVAIIPASPATVTTNSATAITDADATLNGTNGDADASGHSFWASLDTFSTESPTIPGGVFSTPDLGVIAADTAFSASLSSTGITVTPNTTYYFAAWSNVDGTWYPGAVLNFTTSQSGGSEGTEGTIEGTVSGGPGVLHVDSITSAETNANGIADGTYEHGWSYTFHITAPSNEPNLAMKFADWTSGANTLPVANNMKISSAQANNGPVTLTVADTYSSPALVITGDLDLNVAGRQIDVVVQTKIPLDTVNGSYTTSYGVQTN